MSWKRKEDDVGSEDAFEGSPREGDVEGEGRPRFWLVGLVMFGLIVAIIAGAFLLNERFRPRVGIEPAPSVVMPRATAGTPAVAIPPTVLPTATAAPTAKTTQTPGVTATAAATPPAGAMVPTRPTPSESLEREVEQAYLRYWQVYSGALLNLDTSRVGEVATGEELTRIQDEVNGLRQRKVALRTLVTHSYTVFDVTVSDAKVIDEMLDRSFLVDPVTKEPGTTSNPGSRIRDIYYLQKIDGVWKVTKSLREEG